MKSLYLCKLLNVSFKVPNTLLLLMIKLSVHVVCLEERGKHDSIAKKICLGNDQFHY